jgi:hypothetical protein
MRAVIDREVEHRVGFRHGETFGICAKTSETLGEGGNRQT